MQAWRIEIRIFGLLAFALGATFALYAGISAADLGGELLGLEIDLAGPIACFPALLLIFWAMGLFKQGLTTDDATPRGLDQLSPEEMESELDEIAKIERKTNRRKRQLKEILERLAAGASPEEALAHGGVRAVRRPGQPVGPHADQT